MRRAAAARRAKAGHGNRAAGYLLEGSCPGMLAGALDSVPDLFDFGSLPQNIDMPMRVASWFQMMADAPAQPARTEGAANINVQPRRESGSAKSANLQAGSPRQREHKDISTRGGGKITHRLIKCAALALKVASTCNSSTRPISCTEARVTRAINGNPQSTQTRTSGPCWIRRVIRPARWLRALE